jgi:hypothetical protein
MPGARRAETGVLPARRRRHGRAAWRPQGRRRHQPSRGQQGLLVVRRRGGAIRDVRIAADHVTHMERSGMWAPTRLRRERPGFRCAPSGLRLLRLLVGWVERGETHQSAVLQEQKKMGFASSQPILRAAFIRQKRNLHPISLYEVFRQRAHQRCNGSSIWSIRRHQLESFSMDVAPQNHMPVL